MGKDHKALAMIFGLGPKRGAAPPADDGEPDGDEASDDGGFEDAWHEYAQAMKDGDDAAACDAMKAMIDIRIHGSSDAGGDEGR